MPGPLAPPEPTDPSQDALVLRAADAAEVVTPEDAPGMVPVDADRQAQIAAQAREFVDEVARLDPRSPRVHREGRRHQRDRRIRDRPVRRVLLAHARALPVVGRRCQADRGRHAGQGRHHAR
ncbi:hypothetical protein [Curtobacterium sp. MCPF17_052]|uniref:hypothetical protein n=1 Tax=Curtobacterium sp. MCPF17_052 TaxID=2175655 RepID=UPI0024DF3F4B|nr:hypothetical protein [Curtobacterium sp. MCPF17_052]WIB14075.1 hypothetical protein DEJ36_01020 [Curtobacterium sp. MCPF17_052]